MRGRVIVGLALMAVGLVWIGQGLGFLPGSGFMNDDVRWAIIGAILMVVGAVLAVSARRGRPKA
jgi:hypothetical protein